MLYNHVYGHTRHPLDPTPQSLQQSPVAIERSRCTGSKASSLEEQGLIQAFEFTHELAWNTLKDFLEDRGVQDLYGSRNATRQAFKTG